ncbi:MAG TPA: Crp/Fnr family transcriptional regulator [Propionibacteriaceae bacterium]|jgi:CRP-like cAMP-binding protein
MEPPILDALDDETRRHLRSAAQRRRFGRGEVIFHAGDAANSMHLLVSGHVSVQVTTSAGDTAILTVLGPNSTFGEMALLAEEAERSATVAALDPVETLVLGRAQFLRLRASSPAMDRFLVDLLTGYIRRQDARLVEALYVPVDKRVLRRVLAMSRLYGDGSAGTVIPLTQDIIAGMAGTTRPTTNQALRSAEAKGLISIGRAQVSVLDPRGLARQAR